MLLHPVKQCTFSFISDFFHSFIWFIPHHPLGIKYNVSIAERRFNPRAVLDNPTKLQPQNLTLLPGEETCQHIYFHVMVRNALFKESLTNMSIFIFMHHKLLMSLPLSFPY